MQCFESLKYDPSDIFPIEVTVVPLKPHMHELKRLLHWETVTSELSLPPKTREIAKESTSIIFPNVKLSCQL